MKTVNMFYRVIVPVGTHIQRKTYREAIDALVAYGIPLPSAQDDAIYYWAEQRKLAYIVKVTETVEVVQ